MLSPAEHTDPVDKRFSPGEEIAPHLRAWAQLGAGSRCETWLAWSTELWSPVTVKLPLEEEMQSPRAATRLGKEAAALGRLHHPSIQRLLLDRHRHRIAHLVLEYVEGPTLDQLVEDEGPFDPANAIRLGMQIASGLHHLHGLGLVHLDLKPANVVLRDGRAVILDLDIAQPVGQPAPPGPPHGSPSCMAPEQCRRQPASPQMDIFALGTVLYEVISGVRAFPSPTAGRGVTFTQLLERARPLRELRPELPPALDAAVSTLLEPDPARRPRCVTEVLHLLESALPPEEEPLWPDWASALLAPAHLTRS